tara:strand:- start:560 stop:766 length:207 start_codon:yes stop_codon:yes gene_type:complete
MSKKDYRGIYDEGETGRIKDLLDTQRDLFLDEEQSQQPKEDKVQKYFLIAMGVSLIIVITKVLSKWKK